jgi:hypothetical protein
MSDLHGQSKFYPGEPANAEAGAERLRLFIRLPLPFNDPWNHPYGRTMIRPTIPKLS